MNNLPTAELLRIQQMTSGIGRREARIKAHLTPILEEAVEAATRGWGQMQIKNEYVEALDTQDITRLEELGYIVKKMPPTAAFANPRVFLIWEKPND